MTQAQENSNRLPRLLPAFAVWAGAATAAIGGTFFIGWMTGSMTYRGFNVITMKTNAALSLMLCGVALVLAGKKRPWQRAAALALAAPAAAIAFLTLLEHLGGWDLGIDQLLAQEPEGALGVTSPNRMGPPAALSLTLCGTAIMLLTQRREFAWKLAQGIALLLLLIPLLALLGHLYGVTELYGTARFTGVAGSTIFALLSLELGILAARPTVGIVSHAISPDPGASTVRRLLPVTVLVPIILGWLRLQGEWRGLYPRNYGTSLLILSWIIIFSLVVYRTGRRLSRSARQSEESARRFRVAQELSPDGFTIFRPIRDREGSVVDFEWIYENPAAARMNGTDPQQVVGRRLLELIPEQAATPFHLLYRQVAESREPAVMEAPYQGELDGQKWVRVAVVPIDSDIAILAQDLSTQRQAEKKLADSEEKFAKAFAFNSAAMVMTRLEDGTFLEANETWLSLFGFDRADLMGHTSLDTNLWLHREDRSAMIAELRAKGSLRDLELKFRNRNGELLDVLLSAETLMLGGELVGLWSMVDITERKRVEAALRESEERFSTAFRSNPVAVVISRLADGTIKEMNDAFVRLFGYGRDEALGRTTLEIGLYTQPFQRERLVQALQREGKLSDYELTLRRRTGEELAMLVSAEPIKLAGEALVLWNFHDITARKRADEALMRAKGELELHVLERTRELERTYRELHRQSEERLDALEKLRRNEQLLLQQSRLAAMGEMLGNIAHQWRQPLNILGLLLQELNLQYETGALNAESLDKSVSKGMQLILHMSHTIDDFREFLQPEKEKGRFSVNEAVASTVSLYEATLKTMEVDLEVRESGQLHVEGHRNEFCQVIMNMITNARDVFRERGVRSPKLLIELFAEGGRVVIVFTDNGGGIDREIIDKVFDPYFTTKGPSGTGIGLFMSKNIIEKSMRGALAVRNTGNGAQFRIEVPEAGVSEE